MGNFPLPAQKKNLKINLFILKNRITSECDRTPYWGKLILDNIIDGAIVLLFFRDEVFFPHNLV